MPKVFRVWIRSNFRHSKHSKYFSSLFNFGGDKVSTGLVEASVACRGSEALVKPGNNTTADEYNMPAMAMAA